MCGNKATSRVASSPRRGARAVRMAVARQGQPNKLTSVKCEARKRKVMKVHRPLAAERSNRRTSRKDSGFASLPRGSFALFSRSLHLDSYLLLHQVARKAINRTLRQFVCVLAFTVAACAAGCASSAPRPSQTLSAAEPCSLLTKAELELVRGQRYETTEVTSNTDERSTNRECFFQMPDPERSVTLMVTTGSRESLLSLWKSATRVEDQDVDEDLQVVRHIRGVGQDAFWNQRFADLGALFVLSDTGVFRLILGSSTEPPAVKLEMAKRLARLVLEKAR